MLKEMGALVVGGVDLAVKAQKPQNTMLLLHSPVVVEEASAEAAETLLQELWPTLAEEEVVEEALFYLKTLQIGV